MIVCETTLAQSDEALLMLTDYEKETMAFRYYSRRFGHIPARTLPSAWREWVWGFVPFLRGST